MTADPPGNGGDAVIHRRPRLRRVARRPEGGASATPACRRHLRSTPSSSCSTGRSAVTSSTGKARRGWGTRVVDQLARDLRAEFPDAKGFSRANLLYMRAVAEAWPDVAIVQRVVGRLPWGQNIELLRIKAPDTRLWYAEAALANGWSRPVLAAQIDTRLHVRQGGAVTNFDRALPPATSDLARQVLKDPYQFDFLTLNAAARERDLERALLGRMRDLLLELGKGFTFVGSQHRLEVGGQDFYVDLLFYHRRLRCLVAVDLKTGPFQPEHAGKMNFYLAALDDRDREPGDGPSIGLILCREHNRLVVEYAPAPRRRADWRLLLPADAGRCAAGGPRQRLAQSGRARSQPAAARGRG